MAFYYLFEEPRKEPGEIIVDLETFLAEETRRSREYRSPKRSRIELLCYNKIILEQVRELDFLLLGLELVSVPDPIPEDLLCNIGGLVQEPTKVTLVSLYKFEISLKRADGLWEAVEAINASLLDSGNLLYKLSQVVPFYPQIRIETEAKKVTGFTTGSVDEVLLFHKRLYDTTTDRGLSLQIDPLTFY